MRRTAALIVGGGPAGSAAAITLARAGRSPELVEKTHEAHDVVVCGGFLGWDALASLAELGIDVEALGGQAIDRVRLVTAEKRVEAALPHPAAGLSRRTLDAALLAAAAKAGAAVTRGCAVRLADPERRHVRLDDGRDVAADALFLATGKHEVRGIARSLTSYRDELSVGIRTSLPGSPKLHAALRGIIELHLFDGGYAGLLLQEDGTANLCISVQRPRLSEAGSLAALVERIANEAPILGRRMEGGPPPEWQAIAGVPYGWRTRETSPGVFRLGDQGAVISSLAGDGVAIALRSGIEAARACLRDGPAGAQAYQSALARQAALPLTLADALRHAAEARRSRSVLMALAKVPGLTRLAARMTRIG